MKQWLRPQVAVEKFVANEYVAICPDAPTFDFNGHFAVDLSDGSGYSGPYVHDGNADGVFQAHTESISEGMFSTQKPEAGLYTNKPVYEIKNSPSTGFRYNETRYFTAKGTATIWATSDGIHVWGYNDIINPDDYNPATGRNWS